MTKYAIVIIIAAAAVGAVLFMQGRSPDVIQEQAAADPHAGHNHAPGEHPTSAQAAGYAGKVLETMNSGGYTYVHVDTGKEKIWAAGPETTLEVGAVVAFPAGMEMRDFKSDKLGRTFDSIYFVSELSTGGAPAQMPAGHPEVSTTETDMDFSGIAVASGGMNIASIYADRGSHKDETVIVRGKVVKFTAGVMKKNWIHLRDGSGTEGSNDLTLTTDGIAQVGDVIVAEGTLRLDQDFGFGYAYEVLLENAKVTVE
jgi:outer membrane protein assembly factor BamB